MASFDLVVAAEDDELAGAARQRRAGRFVPDSVKAKMHRIRAGSGS
jgi:hypothetical protein